MSDKFLRFARGLILGLATGWALFQQLWVIKQLLRKSVQRSLAANPNQAEKGILFESEEEYDHFTVIHRVEDGIERIVYLPKQRRFDTPVLMQHGMWHAAWCWHLWQELLAEWGWESHAVSLPGHGKSPTQRPVKLCTLDYYLAFLKVEIDRLPRRPILMGHSMGGALAQWYLKHVDDLPAVVLVAPWVSHSVLRDGLVRYARLDPLGAVLTSLTWSATPWVRNPYRAAKALISDEAVYSPEELYARLDPESALILYQHNPPFWSPARNVQTPMLWLAAEKDALIGESSQRSSAAHYEADYVVCERAGHNLMMEHNYRKTAEVIHEWLVQQGIE